MNASAAAALTSSMNSASVISSDGNSSSSSSLLFFKNRPLLPPPASRPCLVSVSLRRKPKEDNIKNNSKPCCLSFASATRSSTVIESATAMAEGQQDIIPISETEGAASKSVARRLILLRHAHSTWDNPSLRDHDRPLSKAGKADAAKVSQKLQKFGWIPQLILSSDALRTRQTLKIMQEQVADFLDAEVRFISSFYSIAAMDGQTADHLQQAICRCSRDEIGTVMCMGHNRGWEEAASMFTGASIELKTCNAALLEAEGKSWEEAFALAGLGGWKLQGIVKPSNGL